MNSTLEFKNEVIKVVSKIPKGRVMTYGQIAAICGNPRYARLVGQIAHFGDISLPWHRVVNAQGKMANGYVPNGPKAQANFLIKEGVMVKDQKLNLKNYLWWP